MLLISVGRQPAERARRKGRPTKKLREITKADAKRWRIWVATKSNKRDKHRGDLSDAPCGAERDMRNNSSMKP